MQRLRLPAFIVSVFFECVCLNQARAQQVDRGKIAVDLLDYAGSTGSALWQLIDADIKHQNIPGDKYQNLAHAVALEIAQGKTSSAITRAPFDLFSAVLGGAGAVDPEPTGKVITLIAAYGVRKMGDAASLAILDKSRQEADSLLARGLQESAVSAADLQGMSQSQFLETVRSFKVAGKKIEEILTDPDSLARIEAHATDLYRNVEVATLATIKGIDGSVADIEIALSNTTQNVIAFRAETENRLSGVEQALRKLDASTQEQSARITTLEQAVGNSTEAIQSLAQISSMGWGTEQKLAALNSGLMPNLSPTQRNALKASLEQQSRTEAIISKLNTVASDLGTLSTIANNLGVPRDVVSAVQTGQVVVGAMANYAAGNYLGAVAGLSSLASGGGDATAERHAAMMSYLNQKFDKIDKQLETITELQQRTLQGLEAIGLQLRRIEGRLASIESMTALNRVALQNLLAKDWISCDALMSAFDRRDDVRTFADLRAVLDNADFRGNLLDCYNQYQKTFDGEISGSRWAGGTRSLALFPKAGVFSGVEEAVAGDKAIKPIIGHYDNSRAFVLELFQQGKAGSTPRLLAAIMEPQIDLAQAQARDQRIVKVGPNLDAFKCDQEHIVPEGLRKPLCQGVSSDGEPASGSLRTLLDATLAGPQALRLIDVGFPLASLSKFTYRTPKGIDMVVPWRDLEQVSQRGLSSSMLQAKLEGRTQKTLLRLQWLAAGYLLQQSVMYGDYVATAIAEILWDNKILSIKAAPESGNRLEFLAYGAMRSNEPLARNVVLIAMRRALLEASASGAPNIVAYSLGLSALQEPDGCQGDSTAASYIRHILPGWRFQTRYNSQRIADEPALKGCPAATPPIPEVTLELNAGPGVVIGDLFIPAPSPEALWRGRLEQPASLRLALQYVNRIAESSALHSIIHSLPKNDHDFILDLLSSNCLNQNCNR